MHAAAEKLVGKATCKYYFNYSMANASDSIPVNQFEVLHLCHISFICRAKFWNIITEGNRKLFKEGDTNSLFFDAIAHHFKSLPSSCRTTIKL